MTDTQIYFYSSSNICSLYRKIVQQFKQIKTIIKQHLNYG